MVSEMETQTEKASRWQKIVKIQNFKNKRQLKTFLEAMDEIVTEKDDEIFKVIRYCPEV